MINCCSHGTLLHFSRQGKLPLDYLLLPPRSVLAAAPPRFTPEGFDAYRYTVLLVDVLQQYYIDGMVWVGRSSVIHFQGR